MADLRTALLLEQAVQALGEGQEISIRNVKRGFYVLWINRAAHTVLSYNRDSESPPATALEALLRDMGEEPAEWPSADTAAPALAAFRYLDDFEEPVVHRYVKGLREVEAEYGLLAALSVPGLGRSDG